MANTAIINLNAKDNTKGAFTSMDASLKKVGTAAKGMVALFAAEKVVSFFTDSIKAAGEYDKTAAKSLKGIGNEFKTLQVAVGGAILGNKELMTGLLDGAKNIVPVIVMGVNLLVKALTGMAKIGAWIWTGALKPALTNIMKGFTWLLDQLEKLPFFGQFIKGTRGAVGNFLEDQFKTAQGMATKAAADVKAGPLKDRKEKINDKLLPKRTFGIQLTESRLSQVSSKTVEGKDTSVFKAKMAEQSAAFGEAYNEAQASITAIIDSGAGALGDSIANAFSAAFSGEGVGGAIKAFGKTILAGVGSIFVQLGQTYLQYGGIMKGLSALFGNPLTAGPAGIAIGAALIAMGGALGAIANGGGKSVARSTGAVSSASSIAQQSMSENGQGSASIVITGGLLDTSNPEQMRALATAIGTLSNRRVTIERV